MKGHMCFPRMSQVAELSNPKDVLVCIGSAGSIAAYANDPLKKHLVNARYIPNENWNGGFHQGKYDGGPQCYLQLIRMLIVFIVFWANLCVFHRYC